MVEVLVSTALGTIVVLNVFELYSSSQNTVLGQTNAVQMQTYANTAMNSMTKELRLMHGTPTISTTTALNDTISFTRIQDSGYSSGGNTVLRLHDSSKSWPVNAFAPGSFGSYSVAIVSGTGAGQTHPILRNSASVLTLSDTGWTVIPDNTSLYYIILNKTFELQPDNTLRVQIGNGPFNIMAANVTSLAFSQPDPSAVTIALTTQTQTVDPRTGTYLSYSLTDTARRRDN